MHRSGMAACAVMALFFTSLADARPLSGLLDRFGGGQAMAPQRPGMRTLSYGPDPMNTMDFYPARDRNQRAPLVLFVHGGGWKRGTKDNASGPYKASHYTGSGYAYATINYRLVPGHTVEDQAADVARSVGYLISNAQKLGFDPSRIVIMGHSAGAHLVALVGTDERYLRAAGLSFAVIDGVVAIDGAAYDVPEQVSNGNRLMRSTYIEVFGRDPVRQRALSPTMQATPPNSPAFLLIHVQRKDGAAQNRELEAALRQAGTAVQRREFPGTGLPGHAEINRKLGDPAYPATGVVDDWLKTRFGE